MKEASTNLINTLSVFNLVYSCNFQVISLPALSIKHQTFRLCLPQTPKLYEKFTISLVGAEKLVSGLVLINGQGRKLYIPARCSLFPSKAVHSLEKNYPCSSLGVVFRSCRQGGSKLSR